MMAPESERATTCDCGHTQDYHAHPGELGTPCTQCGCMKYSLPWKTLTIDEQFAGMASDEAYQREARKILGDPTLTCSEVVERLAIEAHDDFLVVPFGFDREKATQILTEWRERRVQELEECLREVLSSASPNQKEHPTMFAAWEKAEKTLHSEWREQIRKGAKHE